MFRNLFMGRNGPDHICMAALILAVLLNFIPFGNIASILLCAYAIFRMFSKNVDKRRKENLKFAALLYKIKGWFKRVFAWFKGIGGRMKDFRTHRVFKCEKCGQKLRVPRGKGKISIKCTKCGNKFVKTT